MKLIATTLLTLAVSSFCFADTWTVDDDYADYPAADFDSIQDAINLSSAGDEIVVYPGTYTGSGQMVLDVPAHQLVIRSTCGAEQTIIDAENQRIGVYFASGTPAVTIFEGFTITNGTYFNGGGLLIHGGPTIRGCIITGNHASGSGGGGVSCHIGNPTIENCVIRNNTSSGPGGGVHIQANLGPSFTNCSIIENVSTNHGGGVYIQSSYGNFNNCIIANNSSGHPGGGIFSYGAGNNITTIVSCSISGNNQPSEYPDGSGIWCGENGDVAIADTLVCDNFPNATGEQVYSVYDWGGNTISVGCPLGACCLPDGSCEYTDPAGCGVVNFSQWQGIASSCGECDPITVGACCYADDGIMICQEHDEKTCYFLGGTWSAGESCECVACEAPPESGACCFADGSCKVMDSATCYSFEDGQWLGNGTSCEACESEPTGACCFEGAAGLVCQETEQSWCEEINGVWSQDAYCKDIKCVPVTPMGACCYMEDTGYMACEETTEAECEAFLDSTYQGDDTDCASTTCCQPVGACCIAGQCLLASENQCVQASGIYSGNGITCTGVKCAYCNGDLDGDGEVDVDDLLLLIGAWGACP